MPSEHLPLRAATGICAVAYLFTAARYLLGGDNGEFLMVATQGGVPHPSGYPAMALYLRATAWLPGASPAHSAALATCAIGVVAVAAVYASARAWGSSRATSAITATLMGLSALMWKLSTHAEVFALNAAIGAGIIAATGVYSPVRGVRRAFVLGALAGLGLANNHSIVTLAPIGLFGTVRAMRESGGRVASACAALSGLALGLLPYLYLVVVAQNPDDVWTWGDTGSWHGLARHFLRRDFGTTSLAIADDGASALAHVGHLVWRLVVELKFAAALVFAFGLVSLLRGERPLAASVRHAAAARTTGQTLHESAVSDAPVRRPFAYAPAWTGVPRADATVLCVSIATCGPLFISRFNLPLDGLSLTIVERFYLLPMVACAVPLSRGLDVLFDRALQSLELAVAAIIGVACVSIVMNLDAVREHHRPDVEFYVLNSLASAEPNAIVLGTGDHRVFGFEYARRVLGRRRDVQYIDVQLLRYPWYRARIERALGRPLAGVSEANVQTPQLAAGLLATGRPLYAANRFSDTLFRTYSTYPIGTLHRVLGPSDRAPGPRALETANADLAQQFLYANSTPTDPTGWAWHVKSDHLRPWRVLADTYERMGQTGDAERLRNRVIVMPDRPAAPSRPH